MLVHTSATLHHTSATLHHTSATLHHTSATAYLLLRCKTSSTLYIMATCVICLGTNLPLTDRIRHYHCECRGTFFAKWSLILGKMSVNKNLLQNWYSFYGNGLTHLKPIKKQIRHTTIVTGIYWG